MTAPAAERIDFVDVWVRIAHYCFDWSDNSGDLDNIAKPILDAMCGIAIFNDNQVKELLLRRTDLRQHQLTAIVGATPLLATRLDKAIAAPDGDPGFVYIAVGTRIEHGRLW